MYCQIYSIIFLDGLAIADPNTKLTQFWRQKFTCNQKQSTDLFVLFFLIHAMQSSLTPDHSIHNLSLFWFCCLKKQYNKIHV